MPTLQSSRRSQASFASLKPQTRHVSEAAIRKKWKKLSPPSQEHVRQALLSALKQSQSRNNKSSKVGEITNVWVEEVTNRLITRLPRMPFPAPADDQCFDFEAVLQRVQNVEDQLTNTTHSVNLLRAQVAKEEKLLEEDANEVRVLHQAIRANDALRRQKERALHPICRSLSNFNDDLDGYVIGPGRVIEGGRLSLGQTVDVQLQDLFTQLKNHLESMQNNTSCMTGIVKAIEREGYNVRILGQDRRN